MDTAKFEELLMSAMAAPAKRTLDQLLHELSSAGNPIPADITEQLDLLWEEWGKEEELDSAQSEFCLALAALPMAENAQFRKILVDAVRASLPPYLCRPPVMKALGVRDSAVSFNDFAARLKRLKALRSGEIIYLVSSKRWGVAGNLDGNVGSLAVSAWNGRGSAAAVPLEIVLKEALIFTPDTKSVEIFGSGDQPVPAGALRAALEKRSLLPLSDNMMRAVAASGRAGQLDKEAFEAYWKDTSGTVAAGAVRRACHGRSLKEMELLLNAEAAAGEGSFTDEECAALAHFFANLKTETAKREEKLLGAVAAGIARRAAPAQLNVIFADFKNRSPFWPEDPVTGDWDKIGMWGELAAKDLDALASATAELFDGEYLARCATRFPLKSLNYICPKVDEELLCDLVWQNKIFSADLLLWMWKNRKKHANPDFLRLVNITNVTRALGQNNLPKAWGAAWRELRTLFMGDANFHQQMVESAGSDVVMLSSAIQSSLFLTSGERQSMMVKLSRISPLLRAHLEGGAGQRILKASGHDTEAPAVNEPHYTSVKSHRALIAELEDIVTRQVPENREALKAARAHGDFRENSEFDAAKERRNFLSRRRSELERELSRIQPLSMASVTVSDSVVIGTTVSMAFGDGSVETLYLLGAWDGAPERNHLAYRTKLGEALLYRKVGDEVELPDKRKAVIKSVTVLPPELIAELDD